MPQRERSRLTAAALAHAQQLVDEAHRAATGLVDAARRDVAELFDDEPPVTTTHDRTPFSVKQSSGLAPDETLMWGRRLAAETLGLARLEIVEIYHEAERRPAPVSDPFGAFLDALHAAR